MLAQCWPDHPRTMYNCHSIVYHEQHEHILDVIEVELMMFDEIRGHHILDPGCFYPGWQLSN